jgi:hypothetical protein
VTYVISTSGGGGYVAAAYLVFLLLVLSYLAIMAAKLSRIEREVVEIADSVERRDGPGATPSRAREPVA